MLATILAFLLSLILSNVPVCSYIVKPVNTVVYLLGTLAFYYSYGTYGEHQQRFLMLFQFTTLRLHVCSFKSEIEIEH